MPRCNQHSSLAWQSILPSIKVKAIDKAMVRVLVLASAPLAGCLPKAGVIGGLWK